MTVPNTLEYLRGEASFYELRVQAGLAASEAAEWLGRSPRTGETWQRSLPRFAREALILRGGCLEAVSPAWRGFVLSRGVLWSPNGRPFLPWELEGIREFFGLLHSLAPSLHNSWLDQAYQVRQRKNEEVKRARRLACGRPAIRPAIDAEVKQPQPVRPSQTTGRRRKNLALSGN